MITRTPPPSTLSGISIGGAWCFLRYFLFLALLAGLSPTSVEALNPTLTKLHGTRSTDPASNQFGSSVAVSPGWIVVGEPRNDDAFIFGGAVSVHDARSGRLRRVVRPNDAKFNQRFGSTVALEGNLLAVGAVTDDDNGVDAGAVYVFDLRSGRQLNKLLVNPADAVFGCQLGLSVGISGDRVVAGTASGVIYVFDWRTGEQLHRIVPTVPGSPGTFPLSSLSVCGGIAAVGAPGFAIVGLGADTGVVFLIDVKTGTMLPTLMAGDADAGKRFGTGVALSGDRLLVGSEEDNANGFRSGSVYVFDVPSGGELRKLLPADGATNHYFGSSVALEGNLALIGAEAGVVNGQATGTAYLFDADSGRELSKIEPPSARVSDFIGNAVALCGNNALIGASSDGQLGVASGAAYLVRRVAGPLPLETMGKTRDSAPDAPDAEFRQFQEMSLNHSGVPAFIASLSGPGSNRGRDKGVWLDTATRTGLAVKSRQDLGGGLLAGNLTGLRFPSINFGLVSATLSGAGVNRGNNRAVLGFDLGFSATLRLRTGDTDPQWGDTAIRSLGETVLSSQRLYAVSSRFRSGINPVNAGNDSGLIALGAATGLEAVYREGELADTVGGDTFGQFTGRSAYSNQHLAFGAFLLGAPPTGNQAIFRFDPGDPGAVVAKKGEAPAFQPAATYRSFLGESISFDEEVTFRTILAGVPAGENEQLFSERFPGGADVAARKGEAPDPSQPGQVIARFLKFWAVGGDQVAFLAKLRGPGVNPSNDCALYLAQEDGSLRLLMREGDPACGCDGAVIGAIQRVDVEVNSGRYVVLASLGRATAQTNQALFVGWTKAGHPVDTPGLRTPYLSLRKGRRFQSPTGESTSLRGIFLPNTVTDRTGAGNKGLAQLVNDDGEIVACLNFDNNAKELVAGKP